MNDRTESSFISRIVILLYGVVSYFIGVAGLLCLILPLVDLIPFGFLAPESSANPIIWNVMLVSLWGLVHSVMCRDSFKQIITKIIPEPAERPTYVLVAGITSVLMIGLWQHVPGVVWAPTNTFVVGLLWGMFAFGWTYLLVATFAINHFDLFGLRQVYLNFKNQPRPPLAFTKRLMYKFSRHPIQTGVLIGIWFLPNMTATKIILSIGFTVYIFIGLYFEEKDLIKHIGKPYEEYMQETGKFLPKFFK
jgi:protein-S-isoprenylcysteine O-methyltransferase Ste14